METFKKRQKEMQRLEKRREKEARRLHRKQNPEGAPIEVSPDDANRPSSDDPQAGVERAPDA